MKPTLIILHGWGLSKTRFEPLSEELAKRGYPVFAIDLPGFGEAKSPLRPFFLNDYAEYLHDFIKKKKIVKPVLIGHSFGGRVGLRYSSFYPENIGALILTGTPGYTPVSRKKLLLFITVAKIGRSVLSLPTLKYFSDFFRKWYYYIVGAREFYRAEGAMRETFKNIVSEPLDGDMEKVKCPCLLVWGEQDVIVPVWIGVKMNGTIKGSRFKMIAGAGHGVPFKKPKEFVDSADAFLKTLD